MSILIHWESPTILYIITPITHSNCVFSLIFRRKKLTTTNFEKNTRKACVALINR